MAASIAGSAAGSSAAPARAAEHPVPPAAGRWVEGTFAGADGSRRYKLYVPGSYDPSRRQMLVVLLHGCTQDPDDLARGTRVAAHAEREGFLALLPEQPASANPKKCWNWYDPAHQRRDAGEPALIAGMTERVMKEYAVDPARVHLAGISAGAAMASLVAVAYPERYASLGLHSGLAWRPATDVMGALGAMTRGVADPDALGAAALAAMGPRARAVPTIVIHGDADAVVNPANGRQGARQWAVTDAHALGVDSLATTESAGEEGGYTWTRTCHRDAAGACAVEELVVHGLGHAWSGGSRDGTFTDERGPDATRELVRFFREHPMPSSR
ncbi:MAG: alpha/beta hydrolase family esterase [Gemmatimonadaceae bacterium]